MAKKGWTFRPTEFMHQVEEDLVEMQKEMVLYALTRVIFESPVDSGAYRANNRISVGSPDYSSDPSAGNPNIPKGAMDQETYNREAQKIVALGPYSVAYVQNNIIYGTAIEHGHSGQAAQGVYGIVSNDLRQRYGS
ncbi:hypothetical protein FIU88_08280 [Halomonas sp. THAF12]|uniref:hypothetical protein n=1 Tax=Halomonas sp. THAF12 TaxID=2587849 RepID=UPI0012682D0B|nr:hypothetical protein [Halomonas sp. THAF12]QFT84971.1 hypothetical protein FIU88_08280 [Halomonas sp. THAF12]